MAQLLSDLDKAIVTLGRLSTTSEKTETYEADKKSNFATSLRRARTYASTLHNILCMMWRCDCQASHMAKLLLEKRIIATKTTSQKQSIDQNPMDPRFTMLFSIPNHTDSPEEWQEVQFRIMSEEKGLRTRSSAPARRIPKVTFAITEPADNKEESIRVLELEGNPRSLLDPMPDQSLRLHNGILRKPRRQTTWPIYDPENRYTRCHE
jgi:hypothetical protein